MNCIHIELPESTPKQLPVYNIGTSFRTNFGTMLTIVQLYYNTNHNWYEYILSIDSNNSNIEIMPEYRLIKCVNSDSSINRLSIIE